MPKTTPQDLICASASFVAEEMQGDLPSMSSKELSSMLYSWVDSQRLPEYEHESAISHKQNLGLDAMRKKEMHSSESAELSMLSKISQPTFANNNANDPLDEGGCGGIDEVFVCDVRRKRKPNALCFDSRKSESMCIRSMFDCGSHDLSL